MLRKQLQKHLQTKRVLRQSRHGDLGKMRSSIKDAVSIAERPPEVEDRAVPGHWGSDLIACSGNTRIATLVQRQSRLTMLVKVPARDTQTVVTALAQQIQTLPDALRQSRTWDLVYELTARMRLSMQTGIEIYFCDPSSPWQHDTDENTTRLLRQYFPKRINLGGYTQEYLDDIALKLNQRPRKTLRYLSPAAHFSQCVARTGWAHPTNVHAMDSAHPGCLGVNGALACAEDAKPIRRELIRRRATTQLAIRKRLQRAQREAELAALMDGARRA